MCFKKNNKPVRLAKKKSSKLDDIIFVLSIPEVWVIIAVIIIFIISIMVCFNNAPYFYNYQI